MASTDDPEEKAFGKDNTKEVELHKADDIDAGTVTFVSDASEEFR